MNYHTAKSMAPAIGTHVDVACGIGNIAFTAVVQDVKSSWGNIRLLVKPLNGQGESWIELSRLRPCQPSAPAIAE